MRYTALVLLSVSSLICLGMATTSFSYIGCYLDQFPRDMNGFGMQDSSMTIDMCYERCSNYGYDYFGVQFGRQCFCSMYYGNYGPRNESECSKPCQGNASQICGNAWRSNVYSIDYSDFPRSIVVFDRLGCYDDSVLTTSLSNRISGSYTPSFCIYVCMNLGFSFAGSKNGGECYCGSSLSTSSLTASTTECNVTCGGNYRQTCGGVSFVNTYSTSERTINGYIGCYVDRSSSRDVNGYSFESDQMTITLCLSTCSSLKYPFTALQNGSKCYCGNRFGKYGQSGAICDTYCQGNGLQLCGGNFSNLIFYTYDANIILPYGTGFGDTFVKDRSASASLGFTFTYFKKSLSQVNLYPEGDVYLSNNSSKTSYKIMPFHVDGWNTSLIYYRKVTNSSELSTVGLQITNWNSTFFPSYQVTGAFVVTYVTIKSSSAGPSEVNVFQFILTSNRTMSHFIIRYGSIDSISSSTSGYLNYQSIFIPFSPSLTLSNCDIPGQFIQEFDYTAASKLLFNFGAEYGDQASWDQNSLIPLGFSFPVWGTGVNQISAFRDADFYLMSDSSNIYDISICYANNYMDRNMLWRALNTTSDLSKLTTLLINSTKASSSFSAKNALVITWAVQSATDGYGITMFQAIFVTDGAYSYIIYDFAQSVLSLGCWSRYVDASGTQLTLTVSPFFSNIGVPGIFVMTVNTKDYSYIGCYADSSSRDLDAFNFMLPTTMTIELCYQQCYEQNYDYFGVQSGNLCSCHNKYGSYGLDSPCNKRCYGDSTEICGGQGRNSIRKINYWTTPRDHVVYPYLGCYGIQTPLPSDMYSFTSNLMSPGSCVYGCRSSDYSYGATFNSKFCLCFNDLNALSMDSSSGNCDSNCLQSTTKKCGGSSSISLYQSRRTLQILLIIRVIVLLLKIKALIINGFMGCFVDQGSRDLDSYTDSSTQMNIEDCLAACSDRGYQYGGIQFRQECRCGPTYGKYGSSSGCNMFCANNPIEICGGELANMIFETSAINSGTKIVFAELPVNQRNKLLATTDVTNCALNCSNNGDCLYSNNTLSCECYSGFAGPACNTNLNPCSYYPCLNDGNCTAINFTSQATTITAYNCSCQAAYFGSNCEKKVDLCLNVTCSGHGTCQDLGTTTKCSCFSMYSGADCEIESKARKAQQAVVTLASIIAIICIVSFYVLLVLMDLFDLYVWWQAGGLNRVKPRRKVYKLFYTA